MGVATDAYRIYTATDKVKTSVEVAGGWTGAAIARRRLRGLVRTGRRGRPMGLGRPRRGHAVAGGIGYFAGSEIAKTVYELIVEGKALEIGR